MTYTPVNGTKQDFLSFVPNPSVQVQAPNKTDFADVMKDTTTQSPKEDAGMEKESFEGKTKENIPMNKNNAKPIREATQTSEKAPADVNEETAEALEEGTEEILGEVITQIAEEFDLDEEKLLEIMETLGLTFSDLLQPENLTSVILTAAGEEPIALVTDADLSDFVSEMNELVSNDFTMLCEEYELPIETVKELLKESEIQTPENEGKTFEETLQNQENTLEVSKETENTSIPVEEKKAILTDARATSKETTKTADSNEISQESIRKEETVSHSEQSKESKQDKGNHEASYANEFFDTLTTKVTQSVQTATGETLTFTQTRDILNQVIERVHVEVKPDTSHIEMQLHPESLGTLNIHLSSKEGIVTASFTTQNETVRAVLESQMVELKQTLEEQGMKVDTIEVKVQTNAFEQAYENSKGNQSGTNERRNNRRTRITLDSLDEEVLSKEDETLRKEANGSTVDYQA